MGLMLVVNYDIGRMNYRIRQFMSGSEDYSLFIPAKNNFSYELYH